MWQQSARDNNKENTRPAQKPQPRREKDERGGPSSKRPFVQDEEDDEDDDEAFQTDTRPADPARVVRPAPSRSAASRPAKRTRVEDSDSSGDQPRRRREPSEPEDEPEAPPSPPISATVKAVARANVQNATLSKREPQTRKKWSDNDEAELIRLIGEHGCSWSKIAELGEWEIVRKTFPVQLKDKARNIKVSYLK